jgi:hypothetical protein
MTPKRSKDNRRRIKRWAATKAVVLFGGGFLLCVTHGNPLAVLGVLLSVVWVTSRFTVAVAINQFDLRQEK